MLECTRASITTNSIAKEFSKGDKELQRLYEDVCDNFFVMLSNEIMSGETVKLPMRLGHIGLRKMKKKSVDWKTTKQVRMKVDHKNFLTDGYIYKWFWYHRNNEALFTNNTLYSFTPTRTNKRALCKKLRSEYIDVPVMMLNRGPMVKAEIATEENSTTK